MLSARTSGEPKWRWVYRALQSSIAEGRLLPGTRLPSTRKLSEELGIARGTVAVAFDLLLAEGFISCETGRGAFVSRGINRTRERPLPANRESSAVALSRRGRLLSPSPYPLEAGRTPIPFAAYLPAVSEFPVLTWQRLTVASARRRTLTDLSDGAPQGYYPLRQALAEYLEVSRGVRSSPGNIIILSSSMQALDVSLRLFTDPGDLVVVEDPCYRGALQVLRANQVNIMPLPVDESGMRTDRLPAGGRARFVYITPAHQAPTGAVLSAPRRLNLIEWAQRNRALIFEDDYDGEYRYSGHPIPALQSHDGSGVVLHSGSFSKTLFPALRLAYLVVPDQYVDRFSSARSLTSRFPGITDQATLSAFIEGGYFSRHLARMRKIYSERHEALSESFIRRLSGAALLSPIRAGLQTICRFTINRSEQLIVDALRHAGLEIHGVAAYRIAATLPPAAVVGFAPFPVKEIDRAVARMANVLASL